jgi:hypothetical protein
MNIAALLVLVAVGQSPDLIDAERKRILHDESQRVAARERIDAAIRKGEVSGNAIGLPLREEYQKIYQFDEGMSTPVVKDMFGSVAIIEVASRFTDAPALVALKNVDLTKLKRGEPNPGLHKAKFVYTGTVKFKGVTYIAFEVSRKK